MTDRGAITDAGGSAGTAASVVSADGHTRERDCLNCGSRLAGDYCHACGQKAHVHRTLAAFWHDLAHSVLHFDGKMWRTLPLLALRPGELTRRYIDGERTTFVSPMALFLFTVFLMFAIFSVVGIGVDPAGFRNAPAEVRAALNDEKEELAEHLRARENAIRGGRAADIREAEAEIRRTRQAIDSLKGFIEARPDGSGAVVARTGWQRFDAGVKKLNENPALAFYKLQSNAYKFSWALIPISVPFVWLLFLHRSRYRRFGAYDHVVFVTYSITFMSLALIVSVLFAQTALSPLLGWLVIPLAPLHMYRQLRGAYELSRWSAVWRTVVLLMLSFLAITLFMLLLAALGIAG